MSNDHHDRTVLYLTHNYPRHPGDFAGAFVARLAELVAERGCRAVVLAPHTAGIAEEETVNGVVIRRFRYAPDDDEVIAYRGELGKIALWGPRGIWAYRRFLRAFTRSAQEAWRQFKPSAVHAHWWIPGGMVASKLPAGHRTVLTMHGTDIRLLAKLAWLRPTARRVFTRADDITVVSSALNAMVGPFIPDAARKLSILPMPPNDAAFLGAARDETTNSPPLVLCVTRFTDQKRNDLLLRSVGQLVADGVDLRLKLIGNGPLEGDLRAAVDQLGLQDVVAFAPPMAQEELAAEYSRADLVVLPSVDEGLGMVLIEAQMCGTAVLGVRSGGIVDVIDHGETGWLVAADDRQALASGIRDVLADPERRAKLAAAGRRAAIDRFSANAITNRFWFLYGFDSNPGEATG